MLFVRVCRSIRKTECFEENLIQNIFKSFIKNY